MSTYKTEIQSNNADLQKILDVVSALPESGSSGENLDEEIATQDTLITSIQSKLDGDIDLNVCTVTFPQKNMDETIYYTGSDFQLHSHTAHTGSSANGNDTIGHGTISVIKGSIIYSDDLVFGTASVYLTDENENINIINQQTISVHGNITFSYADNAPV